MPLQISAAFNSSLQSHEHVVIAEELGYRRAWFYDSPALYADVWVQLCRSAERTSSIGLGPAVMVPSLRHPMTNAAAIATLAAIAGPGRVSVAIGTGFTGRITLGKRPLTWAQVIEYLSTLKALLRGEEAEWEGSIIKMMHYPDWAPPRPIEVPFIVAVQGEKGIAAAREHGDGVVTVGGSVPEFDWNASTISGTVLADGEDAGSPRVLDASGATASLAMHMAMEFYDPETLPNGVAWKKAYADIPAERRHLALHDGHAAVVNDIDRPFLTPEVLEKYGNAMDKVAWRELLAKREEEGATEIIYRPSGDDIRRELEAFADMAMG